jgi:hypothetical protein
MTAMATASWTPPANPDPFEILNSAGDDTRIGSYAVALAKFLWFHENALRYDPAKSAVRLSFALADWWELADLYPPAREAFLRTRDHAEAAFREDPASFDLFQEVAFLNDHMGEGARTAELFEHVTQSDFEAAKPLYHVAERRLIAAGRYDICGLFLDPENRMELAESGYRAMRELEDTLPEAEVPVRRLARTHYIRNVAALVALLMLNNRPEDAQRSYEEALRVFQDDEFRQIMAAAMTGHFPDPR